MKKIWLVLSLISTLFLTGCFTSVEQGHVGVRVWPNGQIDERELPPGFAQTMWGSVRHYVANDITWTIDNLHPQTKDKSNLHDLDLTYTYNIEPSQITDSVIKYKGRDAKGEDGSYYPLALYIENVVTNATSDIIKQYDALDANQNREEIRQKILDRVREDLTKEGFGNIIKVHQMFIKNLALDPNIVHSATEVITAQNNLNAKIIEVKTAKEEASRLGLLAANKANIDYMNANSLADIAAAVREGKVSAIVIPYDFRGIVNLPAPK